jgi:hypothetical protein
MAKPGRPCQVCCAEEYRLQIDQRLRDGEACTTIAKEFGFSVDSVERHRANHVRKIAKGNGDSHDPATLLHGIITQCAELAATCRSTNDARGAIEAVGKQLSAVTALIERESIQKEESKPVASEGLTLEYLDALVAGHVATHDPCPFCHQLTLSKLPKLESAKPEAVN